jgi:hypothetical protein
MTNKANYYDVIIVGSGISGLYSAYNIKQMSPKTSYMVLEKYKKQWIGGRINNEEFYGTTVVTGAGIGRKKKDYLLVELLDKMGVKYSDFEINMNYIVKKRVDIEPIVKELRKEYKRQSYPITTFRHFAKGYLGAALYKDFITNVGYTDYEDEDVHQTLYEYGMDDNSTGLTSLSIPWHQLIQKLVVTIGSQNVRASNNVESVVKVQDNPCLFELTTEKGVKYYCKKVIIATTITGIHKLLPQYKLYNQIKPQPFLRLYAKFPKASALIMRQLVPTYTIVSGPLQKIIPMSLDKGVYMIAYSDNKNALLLKDHLENNVKNREFFCDLLEKALGLPTNTLQITALLNFYWPVGTHYYTPLDHKSRAEFIDKAQHPMPNMLVVGEVVASNQGWTEGALDSVKKVLTKEFLKSDNC